jgi:hypothetical protein
MFIRVADVVITATEPSKQGGKCIKLCTLPAQCVHFNSYSKRLLLYTELTS